VAPVSGHQHEKWQEQEHPDGGVYCAACGERPDPVQQALAVYRAAVDEVRRAEYAKQRAAQALYEARKAAGTGEAATVGYADGDPLPANAFHARIAYVEEPTKDGRVIAPGAVDWQFGQRVPLTSGFEGGQVIGWAIPSHIDPSGAVMATLYVEEGQDIGSFGIGLDNTGMSVNDDHQMTITSGRLRHVAAQSVEAAAWPGVVVKREV
jgi:hypothetical protein